jgi:lipopolysaccharide biosynthesis protein
MSKRRILVCYAYHESKESRKNLNFFLKKGVSESKNIDFIFIINGFSISIEIPKLSNIMVITRENTGYDFAAWSHALFSFDYSRYNYFVFINSTVRGPFLPVWVPEDIHWTDYFISYLDEETKLVGTTINYYRGKPHVQSMVMVTDLKGLELGIKHKIFGPEPRVLDKGEIVKQKEVGFSTLLLSHGYRIKSMLTAYSEVDFRIEHSNKEKKVLKERYKNLMANSKHAGDPLFPKSYFGVDIHPFEVIFFKTNRKANKDVLEKYTKWILNE